MLDRNPGLRSFGFFLFFLCLSPLGPVFAKEGPPPGPGDGPAESDPTRARPLKIEKPEHPFTLPAGPSREAWEKYTKNDIKDAEAGFRKVIAQDPKDLEALEGLRACCIYSGRYRDVQQVNIQMVEASADSPFCSAFAMRAMDGQAHSESRALLLAGFERAVGKATPTNRVLLMDLIATLHLSADRTKKARAALKGLGYVDRWLFVAGPFGFYDRNNRMARRFPPERALKALAFKDERGKPVMIRRDAPVPFRTLSLNRIFPGARGVFYAFTNLQCEREQEVLLVAGVPEGSMMYLRGMPILQQQLDVRHPRSPQIVRTRLAAGPNPLLVKIPFAGGITIRVMSTEFTPVEGLAVKPLKPEALAGHEVIPIRGFLFSKRADGALASHYLKQPKAGLKPGGAQTRSPLKALALNGSLNVAQARWLEISARQENDLPAREAVARTLIGSFPDSVGILDTGASILSSVGREAGHTESRHAEEARLLRRRGLDRDPESHQHLLGLYYFFLRRDLRDQAFDLIKKCAGKHPRSAKAQEQLGQIYLDRKMVAQAQAQFEMAAKLDDSVLPRLASFHEHHGSRPRSRELHQKLKKLGMEGRMRRIRRLLTRGELDTADRLLTEHELAYPDRKDQLMGIRAELLLERSDLKGAFELRKKLVKMQPKNRQALLEATDLALRLELDAEAKNLLRGFLKAHPGNFELRRRLRELEGKESRRWWAPYDINVSEIDTSKYTQENYPRSTYAWIVDFMVTRIHPDLSRESYVHIAQKVLNLDGINELSEVLVQAQSQDLVFIRTLNPDGSSYQPKNVLNFNLAQSASLYKVGPGSILEHAYMEHQDADEVEPVFNMGFNFNALDAPRAVSRWVVMIPDDANLDIRKIRPEMVKEEILKGPEGYTVYQWTNTQVEGIKREPSMPREQDEEVIPLVVVETPPRDTLRVSGWLLQRERLFLPEEAEEVARKLTERFPDERVRFDAIVEWVRRNIQPGKEARTLEDVWVLRSGNTAQMADLATALCRTAGLTVRRAFVNGTYRPGRMWRTKNARNEWEPFVLSAFATGGRMMVLEPTSGAEVWRQFTGQPSEYFSPRSIFGQQAGALALCTGDEGVLVKHVRGEDLGKTNSRHRVAVYLDGKGGGRVQGRIKIFGILGGQLRRALSDPKQAERVPQGLVRSFWPRIQAPQIKLEQQGNSEVPLELRYMGEIGNLAEPAEGALFLAAMARQAALLGFIGPGERTHDLVIRSEWAELDDSIRYEAPEGHSWVEAPDDLYLCTEFGFYILDFSVKGRTLTCNRSYLLPMQRISPAKYPKFMTFLRRIAETERQRIAYGRKGRAGFRGLSRPVLSMGYVSHGGEGEWVGAKKKPEKKELKE